jgi:hypothetical protein
MNAEVEQANKRIGFLTDRMAILLVICKSRYGDWNPVFRDGMYDDEGSMGEEIREWPDYKAALQVIDQMLRRFDNENDRSDCVLRDRQVNDQQRGTTGDG